MRSTTLSDSVLKGHSLTSFAKNIPKPFTPSSFSSDFRSKKQTLEFSPRKRSFGITTRFSSQLCENMSEQLSFGCLDGFRSCAMGQEFGYIKNKSGKTMENTKSLNELLPDIFNGESHTPRDELCSVNSCHGLLKFMLLLGFLTFQDSYPALAASDFANGLQSVSIFGDLGDISTGFASAFLLIFFSELGDKTFFIAALLAARNSAAVVFTGTFGALAVMTIISVVLGRTFHYVDAIIPFRFGETDLPIDDIAAVCLLVYFGVSTLLDATSSDGLKAEDEQKEAELAVSELSGNGAGILAAANTIISTFALVFVAEWGDKSFFSTIALAAASSPLGVIGGALAGHAVATLLAVLGGSLLGTFLSEKAIAYVGGVLFLVFAAVTLTEIVT